MKYLLAFVFTLLGCEPLTKIEMKNAQECFDSGGQEYQTGFSGGSHHHVCVYKKAAPKSVGP